jgi:hypothetical protein
MLGRYTVCQAPFLELLDPEVQVGLVLAVVEEPRTEAAFAVGFGHGEAVHLEEGPEVNQVAEVNDDEAGEVDEPRAQLRHRTRARQSRRCELGCLGLRRA